MPYSVEYFPGEDSPTESLWGELEEHVVDNTEDDGRNDEALEFLPCEGKEIVAFVQFDALVGEYVATNESDSFNAKTTDQIAQPPIYSVGFHSNRA